MLSDTKSNGLYRKYLVTHVSKADGSAVDPNAQYLVLRVDEDPAARIGALAYADAIEPTMPELAADIRTWMVRLADDSSTHIGVASEGQIMATTTEPAVPIHAKSVALHPAPAEVCAYLEKLAKVVGYTEPVQVGVIAATDMPPRAGVTDNPNGFLRLALGQLPLIVISDVMLTGGRWQSIVAHEFLHLLRWSLDEFVLDRLPDHEHANYMSQVELTMKPLTILLMVAGELNITWEEGDEDGDI